MRKISGSAVAQFSGLVLAEATAAIAITKFFVIPWFAAEFRGIGAIASALVLFYIFAILIFRVTQSIAPVPTGNIAPGSPGERRTFLYMLHYLLLFNPLIFSPTLPFPLLRLILRALGAKMGSNSYCAGIMMDPQFVSMGNDSIIGNGALIIPHVIEGDQLGYYPVRIGNRATIGARAIVMADAEIGDGATVAVQSVVSKGTKIPAGETWGGTPAKCLRPAAKAP